MVAGDGGGFANGKEVERCALARFGLMEERDQRVQFFGHGLFLLCNFGIARSFFELAARVVACPHSASSESAASSNKPGGRWLLETHSLPVCRAVLASSAGWREIHFASSPHPLGWRS